MLSVHSDSERRLTMGPKEIPSTNCLFQCRICLREGYDESSFRSMRGLQCHLDVVHDINNHIRGPSSPSSGQQVDQPIKPPTANYL